MRTGTSTSSSSTRRRTAEDILIRITVANRGPEAAAFHLLPTRVVSKHVVLADECSEASAAALQQMPAVIEINEPEYGRRWLVAEGTPDLLFTENETNYRAAVWSHRRLNPRQGRHQRLRGPRRPTS